MSNPCCIVGKHAQRADIDRLIRAQQAASRANNATSVPSYSQIAKRFGLARPSLIRHRDECLSVDRGALSEVGSDGIANDSTTLTPAPPDVDRGVHARRGQATGPPSDGAERHGSVSDAAQSVPSPGQNALLRAAQHGAGVVGLSHGRGGEVVEGQWRPSASRGSADAADARALGAETNGASSASSKEEGHGRPTERSRPEPRARARTPYAERWDREGLKSVDVATDRIMHAIADSEITDPNAPRAHGSYVHEIVELVHAAEWEGEITASRLAHAWQKPKLFVLGCFHDACAVMRTARGGLNEEREVSLARWMSIYRDAKASDEKGALKVAAEALKGYDAASGLVSKSTNLQFNILQDDGAQLLLRIVLEELADLPDRLARVRRRVMDARDKLGDPTALLTTGEVAE